MIANNAAYEARTKTYLHISSQPKTSYNKMRIQNHVSTLGKTLKGIYTMQVIPQWPTIKVILWDDIDGLR